MVARARRTRGARRCDLGGRCNQRRTPSAGVCAQQGTCFVTSKTQTVTGGDAWLDVHDGPVSPLLNRATQQGHTGSARQRVLSVESGYRVYEPTFKGSEGPYRFLC